MYFFRWLKLTICSGRGQTKGLRAPPPPQPVTDSAAASTSCDASTECDGGERQLLIWWKLDIFALRVSGRRLSHNTTLFTGRKCSGSSSGRRKGVGESRRVVLRKEPHEGLGISITVSMEEYGNVDEGGIVIVNCLIFS